MNKTLVTGATGQVGRFLLRKLIEQKVNFIGLDHRENLIFPSIELLHAEITNKKDLEKYKTELNQITNLIHLATYTTNDKDVTESGPKSVDFNIKGTINLLEFLPNLENICYASTYMIYGTPSSNPVTEEHPTNPNVVYGASKLATEKYLQIFSKETGVNLSILRLMGIYNLEKPHIQAIPTFIKLIATNQNPIVYGTGEIRRNHLYISDAINAILMTSKNPAPNIFNIGGPEAPSNLELIDMINEKLGKKIKPIFKQTSEESYDFIMDVSKARTKLGFNPCVGIQEGLSNTIDRFIKNGW